MSEIFELAKVRSSLVSLKVKDIDNLTRSEYPYISSTYDYITVTRGNEHILTIIKKDGTTFDFHWGRSGYTCISDGLEALKMAVVKFFEQECHIPLGLTGDIKKASIFYNNNFKKWQLTMCDDYHNDSYMWFDNATCFSDAMFEANKIINAISWHKEKAQTGIDIWRATL